MKNYKGPFYLEYYDKKEPNVIVFEKCKDICTYVMRACEIDNSKRYSINPPIEFFIKGVIK